MSGKKKLPRLIGVLGLATAFAVGGTTPDMASAYRLNNSTWTDHGYTSWSGVSGGYVRGESYNHIRGTSWMRYCNRMSWSGHSKAYAPGSSSVTLKDYWSASTPGNVSFSVPASVSVSSSGKNATWETQNSGSQETHWYSTYPIRFDVGAPWNFYSVNHTASATRRVGSSSYNGPSYNHYDVVC